MFCARSAGVVACVLLVGIAMGQEPASRAARPADDVATYATLTECPGNIAVTPDARVIVSLHPFVSSELRVVDVSPSGKRVPFPNAAWNRGTGAADTLDSVLGIRCDSRGVVWMLDTGMRRKLTPKIVAWDTRADTLARVIYLPPPVTVTDSFVNDLQVDETAGFVYIADPAGGANAALIVVDLATGLARRVLEGHPSVAPEAIDIVVDGRPLELVQPDGQRIRPRIGVNPLALDAEDEWLYFGPMSGRTLHRIRTALLRDPGLDAAALAAAVERYAERPPSDGITIDRDGNIYISAIGDDEIGVIAPDREYRPLYRGPNLSWPDAFSFGPGDMVFVVINQLHRTPRLNNGVDAVQQPYRIGRFPGLAPGVVGR